MWATSAKTILFEDSFLYQDARHIYDYVSAYIIQNPGRGVSESHFNKFFDKESGWRGIVHVADKFFEKKNKCKNWEKMVKKSKQNAKTKKIDKKVKLNIKS